MEVDLLFAGETRTVADDVVEGAAIDVLEDHAHVLEAAQECGDVAMTRHGSVHAEFCEELGGDIMGIGLYLVVYLELDDVWLLYDALEEDGCGALGTGGEIGGWIWRRGVCGWGGEGEDGGGVTGWIVDGYGWVWGLWRVRGGGGLLCDWGVLLVELDWCWMSGRQRREGETDPSTSFSWR